MRGAAGRTIRFQFTGADVFGSAGPAVSTDAGRTWRWLGRDSFADKAFAFAFPPGADDVRFCHAIPYVESNLRQFLERIRHTAHADPARAIAHSVLCRSRKGRDVELLRCGCIGRPPRHRLLLACRHHCCEMMASYELEGVIEAILADDADGDGGAASGDAAGDHTLLKGDGDLVEAGVAGGVLVALDADDVGAFFERKGWLRSWRIMAYPRRRECSAFLPCCRR